jgi:hypothetical protein
MNIYLYTYVHTYIYKDLHMYIYRDRDGGRKNMLRALAKVHAKGRLLDKILRKQNMSLYTTQKYMEFQLKNEQILVDKKLKFEENEIKKKIRSEEKDLRLKQIAQENEKKYEIRIKIRDMEKTIKTLRETLSKSIRKRKDDAKLRVEIVSDKEEFDKSLKNPIVLPAVSSLDPTLVKNQVSFQFLSLFVLCIYISRIHNHHYQYNYHHHHHHHYQQ